MKVQNNAKLSSILGGEVTIHRSLNSSAKLWEVAEGSLYFPI